MSVKSHRQKDTCSIILCSNHIRMNVEGMVSARGVECDADVIFFTANGGPNSVGAQLNLCFKAVVES